MNNYPVRFTNAINALVRAFFDETLAKGKMFAACAAGNIICYANGIKLNQRKH